MYEIKDKFEDIALAKSISILARYSKDVFKENGEARDLLKSIGLTDVADEYEHILNPYSYNGKWPNKNNLFNPLQGLHGIVDMIKSNDIALGQFLQEYIERIKDISKDDFIALSNNFNAIGYSLQSILVEEKVGYFESKEKTIYKLIPSTIGGSERRKDISFLTTQIESNHNKYLQYYTEAIAEYGNSHYIAAIGSCRILIEKIFEDADPEGGDHNKGFLSVTDEKVPLEIKETPKLSVNGIFQLWLKEKKGFNRYRLFVTMYSVLSGLGQHAEEQISKYDALLCLRMTEDILIWTYQQNKF